MSSVVKAAKARSDLRAMCADIEREQIKKQQVKEMRARTYKLRAIAEIFKSVGEQLHG